MLFIDRTQIKLPVELRRRLKKETTYAEKFFERSDRSQQRFIFDSLAWKLTRKYLVELFGETCAYCESAKTQYLLDIDHFRPKSEACNLDGQTSPDWYWWLAYEWENLYLSCEICNYNKKTLFPVLGKRANIGTKGIELLQEKNILIDPCVDDPAEHLHFLESGMVESISLSIPKTRPKYKAVDRGAVTIEILGLNRPELIESRSKSIAQVLKHLNSIERLMNKSQSNRTIISNLIDSLFKHADDINKYLAARRQIIARTLILKPNLRQFLHLSVPLKLKELESEIQTELEIEKTLARRQHRKPLINSSKSSVFSPIKIEYNNAYIRNIKIQNFRAIDDLEVSFNEWSQISEQVVSVIDHNTQSKNTYEEKKLGWKMLLGENGTGKSSVLKAISLALMGEEQYKLKSKSYLLTPDRIFNKNSSQRNGQIYVELSKGEPIQIKFTRHELKFVSGKIGGSGVFVRGYGSARLYAKHSENKEKSPLSKNVMRVDNLFHPEQLLRDPNEWLESLKPSEFESVGLVLRDLLSLPDEITTPLTKSNKTIFLDAGLGPSALVEQSDGYNSILALVADIMSGLPETMHDKKVATGIVLLDEIDAHLHPKWKMRIVSSLRRCFPGIQFIATTHEPLCLKGLSEGEIAVMKRLGKEISFESDLPSVAGLRVDQLLTSEFFGLDSTIDPDIDRQFQEYYQLLSLNKPTTEQKDRIKTLKSELKAYNTLGKNQRDQLVYDLIDTYIAKERSVSDPAVRNKLRDETKIKVLDLWNEVKAPL